MHPSLIKTWQLGFVGLLLMLLPLGTVAQPVVEVLELDGQVEQASGPTDLLQLDGEAGVSIRALRGFGRLPERFAPLVLAMHGQQVDLLSADLEALDALIADAEAGTLKADIELLRDLRVLLASRDYYDWQALTLGEQLELSDTARLRGDGSVRVRSQGESSAEFLLAPAGKVVTGTALWATATAIEQARTNEVPSGDELTEALSQVIQFDRIEGSLDPAQREVTHKIVLEQHGALLVEAASDEALKFRLDLYDESARHHLAWDYNGSESKRALERADLAPGTYHLRVHRQAGEGGFLVSPSLTTPGVPNDDVPGAEVANDTLEGAGEIPLGADRTGLLGYWDAGVIDNIDWFRLEVKDHGSLAVQALSDESLKFRLDLYDVSGTLHLAWDYNGSESKRALERADLAPGTYHLRVHRQSGQGGYRVSATLTEPDAANDIEPNDAIEQSQPIVTGESATGLLGYWDAGAIDNIDWFRLEVKDHGSLAVQAESDESLKFRLDLYDESGRHHLAWDYNGSESKRVLERADLAPGTYHLRVHRQAGQGGYRVIAALTEPDAANDIEPNDTLEQAQSVSDEEPSTGLLGYWDAGVIDNIDWFRLEMKDHGSLAVQAESDESLKFRIDLYDESGRQHLAWDYNGSESKRALERADLAPGTYHLRVHRQAGQGGYRVHPMLTGTQ